MQKKLIALAVAGLAAAPAFAQSNVTIYGRADYGLVSRAGNSGGIDDINGKTEFASGVQAGSRIGFKGAEDLGNGLKAIFEIEYNLAMDAGTTASTSWGNRHSYVGLAGNFGTVVGGRLDGIRYNLWAKYDPFANGNVGNTTQIAPQADRYNNSVAYISPSFSGLNVVLAYSTQVGTPNGLPTSFQQENPGNRGDNRLYAANVNYDNGPLSLSADYETIKTQGEGSNKTWMAYFGASYDFSVVKVSAFYDKLKGDQNSYLGLWDQWTWGIGAKAPIGNSIDVRAVWASTNYSEAFGIKNIKNFDADKWGIGADYKFSKRTNLYLDYGQIHNDSNGLTQLAVAGNQYGVTNSAAYGTRGFDLGIAHKF